MSAEKINIEELLPPPNEEQVAQPTADSGEAASGEDHDTSHDETVEMKTVGEDSSERATAEESTKSESAKQPEATSEETSQPEAPVASRVSARRGRRRGTWPSAQLSTAQSAMATGEWVQDPQGDRLRRSTGQGITDNLSTPRHLSPAPAPEVQVEPSADTSTALSGVVVSSAKPEGSLGKFDISEDNRTEDSADTAIAEPQATQLAERQEAAAEDGFDLPFNVQIPDEARKQELQSIVADAEASTPKLAGTRRGARHAAPTSLVSQVTGYRGRGSRSESVAAVSEPESGTTSTNEGGENPTTDESVGEQRRKGIISRGLGAVAVFASSKVDSILQTASKLSDSYEKRRGRKTTEARSEDDGDESDESNAAASTTPERQTARNPRRRKAGMALAGLALTGGALFGGLTADSHEDTTAHRQPAATAEQQTDAPAESDTPLSLPSVADILERQADMLRDQADHIADNEDQEGRDDQGSAKKNRETVKVSNDEVEVKLNKGGTFWEGIQEAEQKLGIDASATATANAINTIGFENGEDRTQEVGSSITFEVVDGKLVAKK